jgi:hypothetical protein
VLKSLHEALTEEMVKVAVEKALAKHRDGERAKLDRRTSIERELSLIVAKKNTWSTPSPLAIKTVQSSNG